MISRIFSFLFSLPILRTRKPVMWVLMGITLLCTFFILSRLHNKFIYTFGFTDEGDNISIGYYILQDKKLYQDIFSQHQPLTYYISSGVQVVTEPDNILLTVRRHRQAVMVFSFIWIAFLTVRFGMGFLPFLVILELMKYYYLGHLFLAESLVIYPCVYLFSLFWKIRHGEALSHSEAIAVSICMFFIVFNLLPTAVALAMLMAFFVFSTRKRKKIWISLIMPGALLTGLLFLFTPIAPYIDSAIVANLKYYIPDSTSIAFQVEQSKHHGLLTMIFQPFTYFFQGNLSQFAILQIILSTVWISCVWIYTTASWKRVGSVILLYAVLIAINSRPTIGSAIYFHTFHSLPYYGMFIASLAWVSIFVITKTKQIKLKVIPFIPLGIFVLMFGFSKNVYVHETISQEQTSYINFSVIYMYNDVVKTLASPSDTLAVIPYEELLYWNTGIMPPTRFLFYKAWPMTVPQYKKEIMTAMEQTPPTFIYWPVGNLQEFVDESLYVSIPTQDATISAMFIRRDKAATVTDAQWQSIERHLFKKPELNTQ